MSSIIDFHHEFLRTNLPWLFFSLSCKWKKGLFSCFRNDPGRCSQTKKAAQAAFSIFSLVRLLDAVFLAEFLDTTSGVDDLLLAGVERMAFRAHFNVQRLAHGRTRDEFVAATAVDGNLIVFRVYVCFHVYCPQWVCGSTAKFQKAANYPQNISCWQEEEASATG